MTPFIGAGLTCFRGERVVFAGLGFRIDPGDALVLRGPNGSGKTSLLRLMAGLLRPIAGELSWTDGSITDNPEEHNRRIHFVGHLDAVKPVLTVAENLGFWAKLRGDGETVGAALKTFGISHLAEVPGRYLSAGQRRRLNLARIAAAPAPLWLLDEPTTALDADAIDKLTAAIQTHRSGGGMVITSTHTDLHLDDERVLNLSEFTGESTG